MGEEPDREELLKACERLLERPLRERDIFDELAQRRIASTIAKLADKARDYRRRANEAEQHAKSDPDAAAKTAHWRIADTYNELAGLTERQQK
jgi:hypothetical protein